MDSGLHGLQDREITQWNRLKCLRNPLTSKFKKCFTLQLRNYFRQWKLQLNLVYSSLAVAEKNWQPYSLLVECHVSMLYIHVNKLLRDSTAFSLKLIVSLYNLNDAFEVHICARTIKHPALALSLFSHFKSTKHIFIFQIHFILLWVYTWFK